MQVEGKSEKCSQLYTHSTMNHEAKEAERKRRKRIVGCVIKLYVNQIDACKGTHTTKIKISMKYEYRTNKYGIKG